MIVVNSIDDLDTSKGSSVYPTSFVQIIEKYDEDEYSKGGSTYAVKPHADHSEQDEFWKEMNSDSYAEDGEIFSTTKRMGNNGTDYLIVVNTDNETLSYIAKRTKDGKFDLYRTKGVNEILIEKELTLSKSKEIAKGGSTYYNGGGINDFEIGDKVMYDSYRDGTREGEILREIDDNHFEIGSDFGVSMVHKDKIIGYAPKRMFGLFEQGGNIDDIVAG